MAIKNSNNAADKILFRISIESLFYSFIKHYSQAPAAAVNPPETAPIIPPTTAPVTVCPPKIVPILAPLQTPRSPPPRIILLGHVEIIQ